MKKLLFAGVIAALGITIASAQEAERPRQGNPGPGPRMNPLMAALDANKDGELDADEIANATAALKKLDKNSDGKLTREELRPERPDRPNRPNAGREGRPNRPGGRQ